MGEGNQPYMADGGGGAMMFSEATAAEAQSSFCDCSSEGDVRAVWRARRVEFIFSGDARGTLVQKRPRRHVVLLWSLSSVSVRGRGGGISHVFSG